MKAKAISLLGKFNRLNQSDKIGILFIIVFVLATPFLGGWDFKEAYRAETLSGHYGHYTYNPFPAYWFFSIFVFLPLPASYIFWNLTGALLLIAALVYLKNDVLRFAVTLPCFWIFYSGQVEGFMAGGMFFSLLSNPFLAGVGIFMLSIKPQVGLFPALFVLINKRDWRILIFPAVIYLLSFAYWGWWIPEWLHILSNASVANLWGRGVTLFPYGLILLPLLWRYSRSLKIWLLVESLCMPYFSIYSLALLFVLEAPPFWFSLAMWAFYLTARFRSGFFYPEFIFPLVLLCMAVWKEEMSRKTSQIVSLNMEQQNK